VILLGLQREQSLQKWHPSRNDPFAFETNVWLDKYALR
jgi:hypothetical protein